MPQTGGRGGLDRQMHTAVTTVAGAPRQTTARAGARWKGRPDAHSSADGHWRRRRATRARPAPAVAGVSCRMPDARCQKSRTARGDDGADGGLLAPRAVRTLCAGARLLEKKLGVGGARARCALAPVPVLVPHAPGRLKACLKVCITTHNPSRESRRAQTATAAAPPSSAISVAAAAACRAIACLLCPPCCQCLA